VRKILGSTLCLAVLGCGGGQSEVDSPTAEQRELDKIKSIPLQVDVLAGQEISVLPTTLVVPDSTLSAGGLFQQRDVLLRWTDSIIQSKMESRAPEVIWKFPDELRRMARRSPGVVPDPDRMGQSVMRAPNIQEVPDPLRSNLRAMAAVAGGRLVFIPAALLFRQPEPGVVEAQLMLVLADSRTGRVPWRSLAIGTGGSLERALSAALDVTFPIQTFAP
jgi:hypothetical protein